MCHDGAQGFVQAHMTLDSVSGCCSINRTAPLSMDKSHGGTDAEGETLARG
jgi:hypothetical protein